MWTTDLPKYFANFCEEATVTTESGTELLNLEKFDNAITENINVQKAATKFKSPTDIGWLRNDTTPAKQHISLYATKWINMLTRHMLNTVI